MDCRVYQCKSKTNTLSNQKFENLLRSFRQNILCCNCTHRGSFLLFNKAKNMSESSNINFSSTEYSYAYKKRHIFVS